MAEALISLARDNDCILQVGHLERYNDVTQVIREHIHDPLFVEWLGGVKDPVQVE